MSNRKRVTITIKKDLLEALDRTVDKQKVRNRSHALEIVLSRILNNDIRQAVILASGEGVKMRPFTYEIPKSLIPVNGRPLLEYGIILLRDNNIKNIVITVSHLASKIIDYFGDGSKMGVNITYVKEKKPSGTGGALLAAKKNLEMAPFVLLYSDVLLDLDLSEFVQTHLGNKVAMGTLALTSVADPSSFGSVRLRGSRVVEFAEKPNTENDTSRLVFAGCGAFDFDVYDYVGKKKSKLSLEKDVFPRLTKEGRLYGYPFEGKWYDVSTPEIYEQVLTDWYK